MCVLSLYENLNASMINAVINELLISDLLHCHLSGTTLLTEMALNKYLYLTDSSAFKVSSYIFVYFSKELLDVITDLFFQKALLLQSLNS